MQKTKIYILINNRNTYIIFYFHVFPKLLFILSFGKVRFLEIGKSFSFSFEYMFSIANNIIQKISITSRKRGVGGFVWIWQYRNRRSRAVAGSWPICEQGRGSMFEGASGRFLVAKLQAVSLYPISLMSSSPRDFETLLYSVKTL